MLALASWLRDTLVVFLLVSGGVLLGLFAVLVIQRLIRAAAEVWRESVRLHYQPSIDLALSDSVTPAAIEALARAPRYHAGVIGQTLVRPLTVVRGEIVVRARQLADRTGHLARWRRQLERRAWWLRANSAVSLGLVRDAAAVPLLERALQDDHPQVRAAAVDALGRIGDPTAAPHLLAHLRERPRHQRARVIEALRALGADAAPLLLAHAEATPADREMAADVIALVGGVAARGPLLEWTTDTNPAVRAAAWRALASIGPDERAFFHAVKALRDETAIVRAAAALALGRTGRADAAPHLAIHLDDEWEVAAQSARALARVGDEGLARLRERADGEAGTGREIARQVAWELAR